MVVTYNSIPIVVAFSHSKPVAGEKRTCNCEIKIGKDAVKNAGVVLGKGTSTCMPQDNYDKSVGRKYALKRALKPAVAKLQELGEPVNTQLVTDFLQELHSVCDIAR